MGKIMKNLASLLRKTAIVSSLAVPLVFAGCEPEDITPPKIIFFSPTKGGTYHSYEIPINWHIADDNFKSAWYSIDNGSKRSIPKSGSKEEYFENGNHKIVIGAEDLYSNSSKDSVNFYVNAGILIYPFTSPDPLGAAYNVITTKAEREAYIQAQLNKDWGNTIPGSLIPFPWVCGHYSMQLNTNSRNWGEGVRIKNISFGKDLLYNGYKGRNVDSIKINGGTLVDMGYLGLPMGAVIISDITHSPRNKPFGHGMNWVLTGDDLTKWEDITIIEPQYDEINVQPGGWNIPYNCDEVHIDYEYVTENNFLEYVTLVKFKIENGNPILVEVNDDPKYNIIKHRQK